jgi:hypothetical protein
MTTDRSMAILVAFIVIIGSRRWLGTAACGSGGHYSIGGKWSISTQNGAIETRGPDVQAKKSPLGERGKRGS